MRHNNLDPGIQKELVNLINESLLSNDPGNRLRIIYKNRFLSRVLPEVTKLHKISYDEPGSYKHKDNLYHTFKVVDNVRKLSSNLDLLWAALLHDIGKASTCKCIPGKGLTFYGHEIVGAQMVPSIIKRLGLESTLNVDKIQKLVKYHMRSVTVTRDGVTDSGLRRLNTHMGDDIEDLLILFESDITSSNPEKVKEERAEVQKLRSKLQEVRESDKLKSIKLAINGNDLMERYSIPPSEILTIIKDELRLRIDNGSITNDRESCFAVADEIAKSKGIC